MNGIYFDTELANTQELKDQVAYAEVTGEPLKLWEATPLKMSVGATLIHRLGAGETDLWYDHSTIPLEPYGAAPAGIVKQMMDALSTWQESGLPIVTWNGASFDFRLLGHITGMWGQAMDLALNSYDPMFQFHCTYGFPIGINSVAQGFGLPLKIISGADAPKLWLTDPATVLEYVTGDVQNLAKVVHHIESRAGVKWRTKTGTTSFREMRPLLTVQQCLNLPLPDVSWMDDPIPRQNFVAWLNDRRFRF